MSSPTPEYINLTDGFARSRLANVKSQGALLVIVGETASGKSALGMDLAAQFGGEIVCADSRTIYRGMDIGTAKPSKVDQEKIRHHLLDVVLPGKKFTVSDFKSLAEAAISDIQSRGRLPIVVGGSGLYVDALIYDFKFVPRPSSNRSEYEKLSIEELQFLILKKGIEIPENKLNKRYLIRALETGGTRKSDKTLRQNTLLIGLKVEPEQLKERIAARVDAMLASGLEVEAKALSDHFTWESEPMKSIGYREFRPYFEGTQTLEETRNLIIQSTCQLAKKQRTWFRRNNSIHWLDHPSNGVEIVTTFLNNIQ